MPENAFTDVAFIAANYPNQPVPTPSGAGCTVSLWSHILGKPAYNWDTSDIDNMPDLSTYRTFLVNLYAVPESRHIEQLRARYPAATVIAMPDPSLDLMLLQQEWRPLFAQLAQAHYIAGRTDHDRQVYASLLNIPSFTLPSPVGPSNVLLPYRNVEKENYVLAIDHAFTPLMQGHNYAALAQLQRRTGCRVKLYVRNAKKARYWCDLSGLDAEIHRNIPMPAFLSIIARARITVDLYARHSFHRHAVLSAYLGTPVVTSAWTHDFGYGVNSAFDVEHAVVEAEALLTDADYYIDARHYQTNEAAYYNFTNSRHRLIDRLTTIREQSYTKPGYRHRATPAYKFYTEIGGDEWQPEVYEKAAAYARKHELKGLLDIGCGSGEKLVRYAEDFRLIGVDVGPNIEATHKRYPNHAWFKVDLEHQEVPANSLSTMVICADVLEHLQNPDNLLRNILSILQHDENNRAVLSTPNRDRYYGEDHFGPPPNPCHVREWNMSEFLAMLTLHGFTVEWSEHTLSRAGHPERNTITVLVSA